MKQTIYILMLLAILPLAFALNECKGTITNDEVPCSIFLPINTSQTACNTIDISYYSNNTNLYNQTMSQLNDFTCNSTFNQSALGTYTFSYTTGDSGSIVVEEGTNMILLWYFAIVVIICLYTAGFVTRDSTFMNLGSMGLIVMGIFILINGFSILDNLMTRMLALVFWGIGFYMLFRVNMESYKESLD